MLAPAAFAAEEKKEETGIPPEGSIATSLPPEAADPGGVRRSLAGFGVTYGINYTGDLFGNASGGIERDTHYIGLTELYTNVDFEKLVGWRGLALHANLFRIDGTSISADSIGNLAPVTNIEALASTRLFELWLEQKLLDDRLAIKVGQIAADEEFFLPENAAIFVNGTFTWATIPSDNLPSGGPAYPFATSGVRVSVAPIDDLKLMVGVWNGDPVGSCPPDLDPGRCNKDGLDFRLKDPPLLIAEGAYSYGKDPGGLPGTIKVGGWRHFGEFDDVRRDDQGGLLGVSGGTPLSHEGNYAAYVILDQMIYRLPGTSDPKGISMFARLAGSPSDRNNVDFYTDGGLVFTGLVPDRPKDSFGVAVAYTGISGAASAFDRDSGLRVTRNFEANIEATYVAELLPGSTLQPDFQYFWNPGGKVSDKTGIRAVEDAAVFGARTSVSY